MNDRWPSVESPAPVKAFWVWAGLAALLLVANANTFFCPLVFDDQNSIVENASIRRVGAIFNPPSSAGVGGRPLANALFALNYGLSGTKVWTYHAINLLIHWLTAGVLYGLIWRTLNSCQPCGALRRNASTIGAFAAVLWSVHPLQTEAVTYISQRTEMAMGLCYLLTLYCFVRSLNSRRVRLWQAASITSCLCGMMIKEVMVTAPLALILYDRIFVGRSLTEIWQQRRVFYFAIAATTVALARSVFSLGARGVGFEVGVSWPGYIATELRALTTYLCKAIVPYSLTFDYGRELDAARATCLPYAVITIGLVGAASWLLIRRPFAGFLSTWFLLILAPGLIVPIAAQPIAEHRAYLSLAAVVLAIVTGAFVLGGRKALLALSLLIVALGSLTWRRNIDYSSEVRLWADTVAKMPGSARAHDSLGNALMAADQPKEAIIHYQRALKLDPTYAIAYNNYGNALDKLGRTDDALAQLALAIRLKPQSAEVRLNLGKLLAKIGRTRDAEKEIRTAIGLQPNSAAAEANLGNVLCELGQLDEARHHLDQAIALDPFEPIAYNGLGNLLRREGRADEAIDAYRKASTLQPKLAEVHNNLGNALASTGAFQEAIASFQSALTLRPDFAEAHNNLGAVLVAVNQFQAAVDACTKALTLNPNYAEAHYNRGIALMRIDSLSSAKIDLAAAVQLNPNYIKAHYALAKVLIRLGDVHGARTELQETLRLAPNLADAQAELDRLK